MRRFNHLTAEPKADPSDPPGYRTAWANIDRAIGSDRIGGNILEVPPGGAATPYHWEASLEEWVWVLEGSPTVRTPEGEESLQTGDIVCFPAGPRGAHQLFNRTDQPVRLMMLSDRPTGRLEVIVYPDSDKIALWSEHEQGRYRLGDAVDYWHGEPPA